MTDTIAANGQTLCHKKSPGMVRSTVPDVCKAPTYPAPFTNVAFAKQLAKGTKKVLSHKGAMIGLKGSEFSTSIGDEPGVGGGVVSGVNKHKATWLSWSPNVFAEGKPVTRLSDKMLMNKGNTVSAGGYYTGPVTAASKVTLDLLCLMACNCVTAGTERQRCVHLQVKALPKTADTGIYSEVTFDTAGIMQQWPDGTPKTRYGFSGSRLDIVTMAAGVPVEFVEMKFGPDTFSDAQLENYPVITRNYGQRLQELFVSDCECDGETSEPVPVEVPAAQPEEEDGWTAGEIALGVGGAVVTAGVAACFLAGPCTVAGAVAAVGAAVGIGAPAVLVTQ